jgi:hypothetical protein
MCWREYVLERVCVRESMRERLCVREYVWESMRERVCVREYIWERGVCVRGSICEKEKMLYILKITIIFIPP